MAPTTDPAAQAADAQAASAAKEAKRAEKNRKARESRAAAKVDAAPPAPPAVEPPAAEPPPAVPPAAPRAAKQFVELENRMRWTIDMGTFDNPGGNPDRVHVFLGSIDDNDNDNLAPSNKLVLGEDDVAPAIRVFPRVVVDAAMKLKANAGMVTLRQVVPRGV